MAHDSIPADLALEVVQHLADSEPSNRSMAGMDLLHGTSVEDMFVLDGETIRAAVELILANAIHDGVIAAPAPVKEAAKGAHDWNDAPDDATHYQPHQRAYYKRVSATEWYIWNPAIRSVSARPSSGSPWR